MLAHFAHNINFILCVPSSSGVFQVGSVVFARSSWFWMFFRVFPGLQLLSLCDHRLLDLRLRAILRLLLIGERFFLIFQSLEIINWRYVSIYGSVLSLSWNSPEEEAKQSSSLNFTHLFGKKIRKIWKIEKDARKQCRYNKIKSSFFYRRVFFVLHNIFDTFSNNFSIFHILLIFSPNKCVKLNEIVFFASFWGISRRVTERLHILIHVPKNIQTLMEIMGKRSPIRMSLNLRATPTNKKMTTITMMTTMNNNNC